MATGLTLYEKIWARHVVREEADGVALLYVDAHLLHEVTSPQAFEGLRRAGRKVRCPERCLATLDHNVPTEHPQQVKDAVARTQLEAMRRNAAEAGIECLDPEGPDGGVVHLVGPEQGMTRPGMLIVCGDSHTATHGAFGALAFGIGTSEVEHVLATQTIRQRKSRAFRAVFEGRLPVWATAKDMMLRWIRETGAGGATGGAVEYAGEAVRGLDMAGRMTMCNMSIEAGARAGMVAPDEVTFAWLAEAGRRRAPKGEAFERAVAFWRTLRSDEDATFDREWRLEVSGLVPQVTWGTSPAMGMDIDGTIPEPEGISGVAPGDARRALEYMGLVPGQRLTEVPVDVVFIGSCTNGRIEDLRAAARILEGRRVAAGVRVLVVPGSARVKAQAEAEGLDRVFRAAGAEWRHPGCSMCLAMNPDRLEPGQRAASTSNRNFEGRQGAGGRTHLVSPTTAAATAVAGRFADARPLLEGRGAR